MAARDRYTVELSCGKCGTSGVAEVSEDDYPFMKKLHFSVDSVPKGFRVQKMGENLSTTEFICTTCGKIAR